MLVFLAADAAWYSSLPTRPVYVTCAKRCAAAWSTETFVYADSHNGERCIGLRAGQQLTSVHPS